MQWKRQKRNRSHKQQEADLSHDASQDNPIKLAIALFKRIDFVDFEHDSVSAEIEGIAEKHKLDHWDTQWIHILEDDGDAHCTNRL